MPSLKKWWYRLTRKYPVNQPLVYTCRHNGVVGVVRAEDYDAEISRMRRLFLKYGWSSGISAIPTAVQPKVFPVFLFGPEKPGSEIDLRSGTIPDLWGILNGMAVEKRSFEVPWPYYRTMMVRGYYSDIFEQTGQEGSRVRRYTQQEVLHYLQRGRFLQL